MDHSRVFGRGDEEEEEEEKEGVPPQPRGRSSQRMVGGKALHPGGPTGGKEVGTVFCKRRRADQQKEEQKEPGGLLPYNEAGSPPLLSQELLPKMSRLQGRTLFSRLPLPHHNSAFQSVIHSLIHSFSFLPDSTASRCLLSPSQQPKREGAFQHRAKKSSSSFSSSPLPTSTHRGTNPPPYLGQQLASAEKPRLHRLLLSAWSASLYLFCDITMAGCVKIPKGDAGRQGVKSWSRQMDTCTKAGKKLKLNRMEIVTHTQTLAELAE